MPLKITKVLPMKIPFFSKIYSIKKSTQILKHTFHAYTKKKSTLNQSTQDTIEKTLSELQESILKKDKQQAYTQAATAEQISNVYLKKTSIEKTKDLAITLILALCAAVVIRQTWFELYEIPTGSMRPTLKEKDRLFVSKTPFGINIPLTTEHLLFDPDLVQRNGIFVFTGENMNIQDVDTKYFYIFPGKKQYIKRLMGKPGDTLYFYGGKIYGIDALGNNINDLLQPKELNNIEHIPFIYWEGKVSTKARSGTGFYHSSTIYQMDEPVARLFLNGQNQVVAEMLPICSTPSTCNPPLKEYYNLWGFDNFGTTKILTKEELKLSSGHLENIENNPSDYYLEIKHHPSLQSATLSRDERGRIRPILGLSTSILPLNQEHIKQIFRNLYTARFIVQNGFARRYGLSSFSMKQTTFLPQLSMAPDGTYEFYNGKAYEILWQGIAKELPDTHPLTQYTPETTLLLYNLGIEFDTRFSPQMRYNLSPSRYTYFRDGDLYLMGAPILQKEDPSLKAFVKNEEEKQKKQNIQYPYAPFIDQGPPILANGSLDVEKIKKYGLVIPDQGYLALGDNHAMSADSRDFGFVPASNIRGAPNLIFWPYGPRWGYPNQPPYPFINLPRSIVWIIIATGSGIYFIRSRKKNKLPLPISQK